MPLPLYVAVICSIALVIGLFIWHKYTTSMEIYSEFIASDTLTSDELLEMIGPNHEVMLMVNQPTIFRDLVPLSEAIAHTNKRKQRAVMHCRICHLGKFFSVNLTAVYDTEKPIPAWYITHRSWSFK